MKLRRPFIRASRALFAFVVITACGSSGKSSNGTDCPAGYVSLPGQPSCSYQCTPTSLAPADPIDAEYTDDNCDGSDGVVASCLFVASDGSDVEGAGSPSAPMKTIAYAITAAQAQSLDVCVSGEIYEGTLNLVSGVSVYGGFDEHNTAFPFRRSATAISTLQAKGTVVVAAGINADTYLEGFTINALTADPPATGQGTYGARCLGGTATLYIRYNTITVGPGQDGTVGTDGATGPTGTSGKDGEIGSANSATPEDPNPPGGSQGGPAAASTCGGAASGAGGQGGYDSYAGNAGGSGSEADTDGGGGGSGNSTCQISSGGDGTVGGSATIPGASGSDGIAPSTTGKLGQDATYASVAGADGTAGVPGNSAGGGGGGGGGTNSGLCKGDRGAGGGSGGTGGCGGTKGTGGSGGGASFGVSAVAGNLVCGGNTISTSQGGSGGAGGKGGPGGNGGSGGLGQARMDDGGASGNGGKGSAGGSGGNGSGGAGGPTACFATSAGVSINQTPVNQCAPAALGGAGGAGGSTTNPGATGTSGPALTF